MLVLAVLLLGVLHTTTVTGTQFLPAVFNHTINHMDNENITSGYNVPLYDAEQVSTYSNYYASEAIDWDINTYSWTLYGSGTHWFSVKMDPIKVFKVKMRAFSYGNYEIKLTLHNGGSQVGVCQTHGGDGSYTSVSEVKTQYCQNVVADKVMLTVASGGSVGTTLAVFDIKVERDDRPEYYSDSGAIAQPLSVLLATVLLVLVATLV